MENHGKKQTHFKEITINQSSKKVNSCPILGTAESFWEAQGIQVET